MIQRVTPWLTLAALAISSGACADTDADATRADKPAADPDEATLAVAKADGLSDWWTTIVGSLGTDDNLKASIDWPDWFHGYLLELDAGETVEFSVTATERGLVRLYGPASQVVDGEPRFDQAAYRGVTQRDEVLWADSFTAEIGQAGTYMLVYGPTWVWDATYKLKTTCLQGCLPEDACADDSACDKEEFCGHNGIYCVTAPCEASYDVCQPRLDVGAPCDRDQMCADGLACVDDVCAVAALSDSCELDTDCEDGFCGCLPNGCAALVCKPYSPEGGRCDGFRPLHFVERCAPGKYCVTPRYAQNHPGYCAMPAGLTVATLLADPAAYDGRFVVVDGYIANGPPMCTKQACPPDNPGCNVCGAAQLLVDHPADGLANRGVALSEEGTPFRCTGNDVTVYQECTSGTGAYSVAGWFEAGLYGGGSVAIVDMFAGPE